MVVPEGVAANYKAQMLKPDFVFITPENQERLKKLATETVSTLLPKPLEVALKTDSD